MAVVSPFICSWHTFPTTYFSGSKEVLLVILEFSAHLYRALISFPPRMFVDFILMMFLASWLTFSVSLGNKLLARFEHTKRNRNRISSQLDSLYDIRRCWCPLWPEELGKPHESNQRTPLTCFDFSSKNRRWLQGDGGCREAQKPSVPSQNINVAHCPCHGEQAVLASWLFHFH